MVDTADHNIYVKGVRHKSRVRHPLQTNVDNARRLLSDIDMELQEDEPDPGMVQKLSNRVNEEMQIVWQII